MRHVIFFALFLYSLQLMSQGNDSVKIVVYDPFNADQTLDTKKDIKHVKNQVKWNIGMLARGVFEIDYERAISEKFSFQVGAGVTYNDWIYLVATDIDAIGTGDNDYKYGPLLTADLRFYPNNVLDFDGLYISVPIRYRSYISTQTITYHDNNSLSNVEYSKTLNNNHKHTEFGFILGTQTGNDMDVTIDLYFGIGMSITEKTYPVYDYDSPPFEQTSKTTKPVVYCGFRIGLPF